MGEAVCSTLCSAACSNCSDNNENYYFETTTRCVELNKPQEIKQKLTVICPITERRLKFAKLLNDQQEYNINEKVKTIEFQLGNFPFDDRLINDGVKITVVGPKTIGEDLVYYGHWNPVTDKRHGFGLQLWPDGSKYIGYWKFGCAHGLGRLIHCEGDVYIGNWKNDMAHGFGEYTDENGMKYSGDWKNDQQDGKGKYTNKYRS